jgi:hypothetical protein
MSTTSPHRVTIHNNLKSSKKAVKPAFCEHLEIEADHGVRLWYLIRT